MKNLSKIKFLKLFLSLFIVSLLAMMPKGYWLLGSLRLSINPSSQVLEAGSIGAAYGFDFISSVGGVDFQLVASPQENLEVKKLKLRYNKNAGDGNRLEVKINGRKYLFDVADWMLVPIAHYADSDYTALVTAFGATANENGLVSGIEEDEYADRLIVHAAIKDELLGIRLIQGDLMLIDPADYYALATFSGEAMLGMGEPSLTKELQTSMQENGEKIEYIREALELEEGESVNTWVLTDQNTEVRFFLEGKKLLFTGQPYYRCYNIGYGSHERLDVLTKGLQDQSATLEKMNPYVMKAAKTTSQLSAFFRYVKINYPSVWSGFMSDIGSSQHSGSVNTPTSYSRTYKDE